MLADLCTYLLPGAPHLRLETIELEPACVTLQVTSTQATPTCPDCGHASYRPHSGYIRTLADLPWADLAARILLRVRRFFCDHVACPRTTFTERLAALVAPHARRTRRLAKSQTDVGLALGGAAGARLTVKQHMPASRNTLLRLIRQVPTSAADSPRVVGLDDWAKRKGHSYGTIVVDLETREPIDLLDDRSAETVELWLKAHPTLEVVSRDRAEADASGATAGAPTAVQVADRFHLLKNLREAIEQELTQRAARISRTASDDTLNIAVPPIVAGMATTMVSAPEEVAERAAAVTVEMVASASAPTTVLRLRSDMPTLYADTPAGCRAETARQTRWSERFAQYTQVVTLHDQGLPPSTIARRAGVSKRTVPRWLAAASFPERKPRTGDPSCLDPFKPFLLESWQGGCQNGTHLWRLIQAQGFGGSYGVVADFLAPLRRGEAVREKLAPAPRAPSAPTPQWYTPRQAAFLFLRPPSELTPAEQDDLRRLQTKDDILTTIYALTQDFVWMLRERQGEQFGWVARPCSDE